MRRKYLSTMFFSIFIMIIIVILMFLFEDKQVVTTMGSILIPIIIGFLFEYDNKQKDLLKNFYTPLFLYICTYLDTAEQSESMISIGKKDEILDRISKEIYDFIWNNANNISVDLEKMLNIQHLYKYFNDTKPQRNYNLIEILPTIMREYLELYSLLNFDQSLKLQINSKDIEIELRVIYMVYAKTSILYVSKKNEYLFSIYDIIKLEEQTIKNSDNHENFIKVSKYLRRKLNKTVNLKKLEEKLKNKFNIDVQIHKK